MTRGFRLTAGFLVASLSALLALLILPDPYRGPLALITFGYMGGMGLHLIPIGHRGVPKLLGGRLVEEEEVGRTPSAPVSPEVITIVRARYELREGLDWQPPRPFMTVQPIDCREKALEVPQFITLSQNRIPITVPKAVIRYRVANPAQSLSITEGVIEKSLVELAQQVLRFGIRQHDDNEVLDQIDELRAQLQERADEQATEWGVDVIAVLLGELILPKEVQADYEKRRREVLQQEAETIELRHIATRVDALIEGDRMSRDQALELIQSERGKAGKSTQQFRLDLTPGLQRFLSDLVTALGRR